MCISRLTEIGAGSPVLQGGEECAALRSLMATGTVVTPQAVAELSPYLLQHIARYGEWSVDIAAEDTIPIVV
jgi:hypothetical protein